MARTVGASDVEPMLNDGQDGEQASFARALRNSVVRNVILENAQMAAALSPSTMEKVGVHSVGMLLSLCAGAANAIAFAKFGTFVSHVSGVSTAIGLRMEDEQPGDVPSVAEILFYFIVGSTIAGLVIHSVTLKMGQARYETVLFMVAGMELLCWWHDMRYPQMIAAAMGLQNAMITSWSGAVLRTTHMTGTATDLGSALGRLISRFLRRGCNINNYSDEDWDQHTVDRQKFVLMNCLLVMFIVGGWVGAVSYKTLKLHALLVPASLTTFLGVLHLVYTINRRETVATEKAAEEMFARQLSGGSAAGSNGFCVEEGGAAGKADDYIEEFIRQVSGASQKAGAVEEFIRQTSAEQNNGNGAGNASSSGAASSGAQNSKAGGKSVLPGFMKKMFSSHSR